MEKLLEVREIVVFSLLIHSPSPCFVLSALCTVLRWFCIDQFVVTNVCDNVLCREQTTKYVFLNITFKS